MSNNKLFHKELSMTQFSGYAKYFDDMYVQKPYEKEVDQLEAFWVKHSPHPVKNIVSFGCGTGTYEIILAKRGYTVTGVDLSPDMLKEATEKITQAGMSDHITLLQGDMCEAKSYGEFDAVIMMFNIAGYVHTPDAMTKLAKNVTTNLKSGGTFIFDAWNEVAVVADPPTDRTKVIEKDGGQITRVTRGSLDKEAKLVLIKFEVSEEHDGKVVHSVSEDHPMRYWGVSELTDSLKMGGLTVQNTTSFADPSKPVSGNEWDMYVVATKPE